MFNKTLFLFCLLAFTDAISNEIETDRNWFSNFLQSDFTTIQQKVTLTFYGHGYDPYVFNIGDARTIAQNMINHGFDPNRPTKIITHGFLSRGDKNCPDFVAAYHTHPVPPNIICIDWKSLAAVPSPRVYISPAKWSIKIGKYLGYYLVNQILHLQLRNNPSLYIHAIGHSLGSHLVANMARSFSETTGGLKIARITGLDPARPYFERFGDTDKLQRTDANFVDVIHSNSGNLPFHLSFEEPMGDVDFYPNGGRDQPVCRKVSKCSHSMATQFYIDSIPYDKYQAALQLRYFTSDLCTSYEAWNRQSCISQRFQAPMGEALLEFSVARGINWRPNLTDHYKLYLKTKDTIEGPFSIH